jgi:hypothetical protein
MAVEMAQRSLEQDLDRVGEAVNVSEGVEAVNGALAQWSGDLPGGTKAI